MTTWTNKAKIAASRLLKEDSYYLLLETGDKILLSRGTDFTNKAKSSTSFTNRAKNSTTFTNKAK